MEPHRAQEEAADVGEEAAGGTMPPVFKGGGGLEIGGRRKSDVFGPRLTRVAARR